MNVRAAAVLLLFAALGTTAPAAETLPEGMVHIPGGTFLMGTGDGHPSERPVHSVTVRRFALSSPQVTVVAFARFLRYTKSRTQSERYGWSVVFALRHTECGKADGASWRHPEGPGSTAAPVEPVTQVSWNDAR